MNFASATTAAARAIVPRHVLPLMLIGMYGIPALIGVYFLRDDYAMRLVAALVVCVACYYVGLWFIHRVLGRYGDKLAMPRDTLPRWQEYGALALVGVYVVLVVYLAVTAERIALFAALGLGNASEISEARETLLQTRTGLERMLIYANAMLFRVVLPFIVVFLYMRRNPWRHAVLGALLFASLLSMEKSLPLFLLVPLFVYAMLVGRSATALRLLLITILLLSATVLLATGMLGQVLAKRVTQEEQWVTESIGDRKNVFWVLAGTPPPEPDAESLDEAQPEQDDALAAEWRSQNVRNLLLNGEWQTATDAGKQRVPSQSMNLAMPWLAAVSKGGLMAFELTPDAPPGFARSLQVTTLQAHDPERGEVFELRQGLRGYQVKDFAFGTPSATPVTLSFWVKASIPGSYGVAISNGRYTRSYVAAYEVKEKNTWERKVVTFPADTPGNARFWTANRALGMAVNFSFGAGEAYRDAAIGEWKGGFFRQRASDMVSPIQHAGATWQITGIQLEGGPNATEFERRSQDREDELLMKLGALPGQAERPAGPLARRAAFIANRVFWIPYITAYDWLRFQDESLKGEFLLGRTAGALAWIQGQERYPMERNIFRYQFGEASSATGSANAAYFADAYVNFGWIGIAVTSVVIGVIFGLLAMFGSIAASAISVMAAFGLLIASLTANLLSGGLAILLVLAYATRGVRPR